MYQGNDGPEADIGLRNVYMRLKYFYQDGFRMEVDNREEGGFSISVFLPFGAGKQKGGGNVYTTDRG